MVSESSVMFAEYVLEGLLRELRINHALKLTVTSLYKSGLSASLKISQFRLDRVSSKQP